MVSSRLLVGVVMLASAVAASLLGGTWWGP
jgi:hypothetical protein